MMTRLRQARGGSPHRKRFRVRVVLLFLAAICFPGTMALTDHLHAKSAMNAFGVPLDRATIRSPRDVPDSAGGRPYYASRKNSSRQSQAPIPKSPPSSPLNSTTESPASPTTPAPPQTRRAITLFWDPVINPDLSGYRLYVGTQSGQYDTTIEVGNTPSYTYQGLREGTSYFFAVSAYDKNGIESSRSNEVTYALSASPVRCSFVSRKFVCTN